MLKWSLASVFLVLGLMVGFVAGPLQFGSSAQADKSIPAFNQPGELQSYRGIVQRVLPGVVSIETKPVAVVKAKQDMPKRKPLPDDFRVPEEFRKYFDQFEFDFPQPTPSRGFGSGVIVDPKGVILTNHHVVQGAEQVIVQLHDGRKFVTKDIKGDPATDLAILRLDVQTPLPALVLGNSDDMEIGDRVLAVGAPFGMTGSVTSGIISGKSRSLRSNRNGDYLQTDAAINPGNSGGPLVNTQGQVIGITTAIRSMSGGSQGVGLAIASNKAKNIMDQLAQNGMVSRGYLGVQIKDLDPEIAQRLGLKNEESGVLVSRVMEGTPAAKAGLRAGDVITTIGGKALHSGQDLQSLIANSPVGKQVELALVRDGKAHSTSATLQEQPRDFLAAAAVRPEFFPADPRPAQFDKFGLDLKDLTGPLAEKLGFKEGAAGAIINRIERGSLADEAGLGRGLAIVKINGVAVDTAEAARTALNNGSLEKGILLEVLTPQGGVDFVLLKAEQS